MDDLNPTTRKFPRTLEEAFPDNVEAFQQLERSIWWDRPQVNYWSDLDADTWVMLACAFAAGFFIAHLIYT